MRLIDADALYEGACSLEAQALDYCGKLIERDGEEVSTEWRVWSAILAERSAFKHDVFDAPTVEAEPVAEWQLAEDGWYCSKCEMYPPFDCDPEEKGIPYCPWCGARMRHEV